MRMTSRPGSPQAPSHPVPRRPPHRPRAQRLRVVAALVVREMGAKFGRSAGGYLWAIAAPLGSIALLSVAFSLALRRPPMGTSFMLFYSTGVLPMTMFNTMSSGVSAAISSNRGLLSYPVVTPLDAVMAKFVLNFMTMLLIAVILYSSIILGLGLYVVLDLAYVVRGFVLAALLGTGVGALNCVVFGFFPTWKNVWGVLTRPLFLISGILFTYESVPREFQAVLWWNPLIHVTAVMRAGFYGSYHPDFVSYPYVLGIALGLFVVGIHLMRRHASFLIEQ